MGSNPTVDSYFVEALQAPTPTGTPQKNCFGPEVHGHGRSYAFDVLGFSRSAGELGVAPAQPRGGGRTAAVSVVLHDEQHVLARNASRCSGVLTKSGARYTDSFSRSDVSPPPGSAARCRIAKWRGIKWFQA